MKSVSRLQVQQLTYLQRYLENWAEKVPRKLIAILEKFQKFILLQCWVIDTVLLLALFFFRLRKIKFSKIGNVIQSYQRKKDWFKVAKSTWICFCWALQSDRSYIRTCWDSFCRTCMASGARRRNLCSSSWDGICTRLQSAWPTWTIEQELWMMLQR